MKILITGASGLLGSYLVKELDRKKIEFIAMSSQELDIVDEAKVRIVLSQHLPTHIINCAAYTNVAQAEVEKDLCYSVNFNGVKNLVNSANELGIFFIHISTDYVFDGYNKDQNYYPNSPKQPLNYYGYTKALAEDLIFNSLTNSVIIRTSWLYGGLNKDFVSIVLNLSKTEAKLYFKSNEFGSPTYAKDLAQSIVVIIQTGTKGLYHLTNKGFISRYEFAREILKIINYNGAVYKTLKNFDSVTRPKTVYLNSFLNPSNIEMRRWDNALAEFLHGIDQ